LIYNRQQDIIFNHFNLSTLEHPLTSLTIPSKNPVRVRFAPSPTGALHLGGARTALFNYLFARHHGGEFILRVEDTDRERSTEESVSGIFDGMHWLGLEWDSGPFYQSQRMERYLEAAQALLSSGQAYRCDCSPDDLEVRRKEAMAAGRPPKYDGRCRTRNVPEDKPHVIRFLNSRKGDVVVADLIRGNVIFDAEALDDLVLVRSDRTPTYNFAVVIDDTDMEISHVIRGDDHINNTPRQILLFEALGAKLPAFAHIPMIHGTDRTKLSKRHGATSVTAYREMGYLSDAMVNYIVRLGWSHKDQEIFSRGELVEFFDLDHVGSSPSIFNPEKLLWLNAHYMKTAQGKDLLPQVIPFLPEEKEPLYPGDKETGSPAENIIRAIDEWKGRTRTLLELGESLQPFLDRHFSYSPELAKKGFTPESISILRELSSRLDAVEFWDHEHLAGVLKSATEELSLKLGQVASPLRGALTGQTVSPGIHEVMILLGKKESLSRIKRAIEHLGETP
jgi:glutamyl-tRNA synthetase